MDDDEQRTRTDDDFALPSRELDLETMLREATQPIPVIDWTPVQRPDRAPRILRS